MLYRSEIVMETSNIIKLDSKRERSAMLILVEDGARYMMESVQPNISIMAKMGPEDS